VLTNHQLDHTRSVAGDGTAFEFTTTLRGRTVSCRLVGGELQGDVELLDRLRRTFPDEAALTPIALVHRLRDAVGSDVVIRVVDDAA
jgi:hypothetical protein